MAWFVRGKINGKGYVPNDIVGEDFTAREIVELSKRSLAGQPLNSESYPKELYLRRSIKTVSNLFTACDGISVVSAQLRKVIEEWQSERVRFHPVLLRKSKTGPVIDEYYFLNLIGSFDAIVEGAGQHVSYRPHGDGRPSFIVSRLRDVSLPVSKEAVKGRHIWLDIRQTVDYGFFISDELNKKLENLNIRTIDKVSYCPEI